MTAPQDPPAPRPPEPAPRALPTRGAEAEGSTASFLAHEGALLLLSLVLALMAWYLVRAQVDTILSVRAQVVFDAPADCQVFATESVTFRLQGKQGELEQVKQRVEGGKDRVQLAIRALPPDLLARPIRHGDDLYRLPFPERLLEDPAQPPLPAGEVVRVRKQTVTILRPGLPEPMPRDWPPGVAVEVELPTASVEVLAPTDAIDGPIEPDPLDLEPFRETASGLAAPVEVTLSFEQWRSAGADRVRRRRAAVALPELRASLRFVLRASESLTGPVSIVIKPGYVVTEILGANGGSFTNPASETGLGGRVQPTFTGEVRATRDLLDPLKARGDLWRWVLRVADADLPSEADATKRVTGTLTLQAFESLAAPLAQGYIVFAPLQVPVEVRKVR